MKIGFKINLESHIVNHANFDLTFTPIYLDFGTETRYINKILKEMATIYARLKIQYKFKYQILSSTSLFKIIEVDQRSDETELFIHLNVNHNLTEMILKVMTLNLN